MTALPRTIAHVTLTTGHVRHAPAAEVEADTIEVLTPVLEDILAGKTVPVPYIDGYSLSGKSSGENGSGRCLSVVVWAETPTVEPICTIGIAAHSRCAARLWRLMHEVATFPAVTDAHKPPPAPWVAVGLQDGLIAHLDATVWLGGFECCLAWTWVKRAKPS